MDDGASAVTTTLEIHLLGRPRIEHGAAAAPAPRGYKAWALLAYLLLSERPPTREELVEQLFGEADDPQGALRWNLSALRRGLPGVELGGDPLRLALPAGTRVDVRTLVEGSWVEALAIPHLGRELLEGMDFSSSPAFDIWLLTQRRHLGAVAEGVLREAALARLARGEAVAAVELAGRLVRLNPLDENFQALLVRSLAASGDGVGAARQVARVRELFRRELGVDPSPAVNAASYAAQASPTTAAVSGRVAVEAQLEAGDAAIAAGALDAGLQCLRRAVDDARSAGSAELRARALVALGSALVHAARGRDEEAAAALHEAVEVASGPLAAAACRELGYVEFLRARNERAEAWLARAAELAGEDDRERGHIGTVLGSVLSDAARYPEALAALAEAADRSTAAGDSRRTAYSFAMIGRVHLLRGDLDAAVAELDRALELTRAERWTAFAPWPLVLRSEADIRVGDTDAAAVGLEHAFALGCQLGDPCWEGAAARGLGLVAAARGDVDAAVHWVTDARIRCARLPDAYLWVEAWALDALCEIATAHGLPTARTWAAELADLAARTGMRDFAARACLHRYRTGDKTALAAAQMLAGAIDSPALHMAIGAPAAPAI